MSNGETAWILLAEGFEGQLGTLRAILDTVRVWGKARREMPRVGESRRFSPSGQSFDIRVTSTQLTGPREGPPRPPTNMFLLDPRGRRLGVDPVTNVLHSEIPAITYSGWGESGAGLREVVEGRYQIAVTGTVAGIPYKLAVQAPDQSGKLWTATLTSRTFEPGAIDRYELVYSRASAPTVTLSEVKRSLGNHGAFIRGRRYRERASPDRSSRPADGSRPGEKSRIPEDSSFFIRR